MAAEWPHWQGPAGDGVWRETRLLTKFPKGGPRVLWRVPIRPGYSGPAVAKGSVYLMDRERPKDADGKPARAVQGVIPGKERVLCLQAENGHALWQYEYDCPYKISYPSGPRTTPIVRDGHVFTLGAMGDLLCLDAKTGAVRWSRKLAKDYKTKPPVWGWSASPLLDGQLLYSLVGGPGSAVVAFNKDTGKEVWKALTTEEVSYSPPVIVEAGGTRQLIVWHSESINGLDPSTGRVFWTQPYPTQGKPQRPAVNIVTPRLLGDRLFISAVYHGPMMLQLAADRPAVSVLWGGVTKDSEKPEGMSCLMPSPVFRDGHLYGIGFMGELCCADATTGKQLWQTYDATGGKKSDCGTAFLIPQGDRCVLFNDQGDLILANLTPKGYHEIDRAHIIDPVQSARGRTVVWSHPAFAGGCVFARNDKELVCISLRAAEAN
jgi:outer membrane protein assembly factor BamB